MIWFLTIIISLKISDPNRNMPKKLDFDNLTGQHFTSLKACLDEGKRLAEKYEKNADLDFINVECTGQYK